MERVYGPSHPILLAQSKVHNQYFEFFVNNRDKMGDSILNIGLCPYLNIDGSVWIDWFMKELDKPFKKVYVIEYHKPNADYFKEYYAGRDDVVIINGDVRQAASLVDSVDTCFWWHGPEHIPQSDLKLAFDQLNKVTKKAMLWVCPWGHYYRIGWHDDDLYKGNEHHFYPENEMFQSLGFNVFNDCAKNSGDGNINSYLFK